MEFTNDVYSGWDEYYQQLHDAAAWDSSHSPIVEVFLNQFNFSDTKPCLGDFGCGDGRNLWPWLLAGARVNAIDISHTALQMILNKCNQAGMPAPTLIVANMEDLPLLSNQFDAVQCIDALPQVKNLRKGIEEITRTLKVGGKFLFNVFTPEDCAYGEGEKIDAHTFIYKKTLFRFFDEKDVLAMLPDNLVIDAKFHESWQDPPHIPFRPYPHVHDGIYFICKKVK